jgi:SAM-dependent methyltransferase
MKSKIYERFKHLSADEWFEVLKLALKEGIVEGIKFPKFVHISRLGSATPEEAIKEGIRFYKLCEPFLTEYLEKQPQSHFLDFGCGTGRLSYIFMKDFPPENILGVDVIPEFIDICKKIFGNIGNFFVIPQRPPTSIPDKSIDIIVAYSVFSHLSIFQNLRWMREFTRILRDGGLIFFTTYGKGFLNYLYKTDDSKIISSGHKKKKQLYYSISEDFLNFFSEILDKGEMLYFPSGGQDYHPFDYGVAFLSKGFLERFWGECFELQCFIDDYNLLEQAFVCLKKK